MGVHTNWSKKKIYSQWFFCYSLSSQVFTVPGKEVNHLQVAVFHTAPAHIT